MKYFAFCIIFCISTNAYADGNPFSQILPPADRDKTDLITYCLEIIDEVESTISKLQSPEHQDSISQLESLSNWFNYDCQEAKINGLYQKLQTIGAQISAQKSDPSKPKVRSFPECPKDIQCGVLYEISPGIRKMNRIAFSQSLIDDYFANEKIEEKTRMKTMQIMQTYSGNPKQFVIALKYLTKYSDIYKFRSLPSEYRHLGFVHEKVFFALSLASNHNQDHIAASAERALSFRDVALGGQIQSWKDRKPLFDGKTLADQAMMLCDQ